MLRGISVGLIRLGLAGLDLRLNFIRPLGFFRVRCAEAACECWLGWFRPIGVQNHANQANNQPEHEDTAADRNHLRENLGRVFAVPHGGHDSHANTAKNNRSKAKHPAELDQTESFAV